MEQIQIAYQPVQDRLLMAIKEGANLYKVWLTRRFVMLFLAQLQEVTKNDPLVCAQQESENKQQIMSFQKQNADVEHSVAKSKTELKIEETELSPLLATGIALEKQTMTIQCLEKKKLTLQLTTTLAYSMSNLIGEALKNTGWGFTGVREVAKDKASKKGAQPKAQEKPTQLN